MDDARPVVIGPAVRYRAIAQSAQSTINGVWVHERYAGFGKNGKPPAFADKDSDEVRKAAALEVEDIALPLLCRGWLLSDSSCDGCNYYTLTENEMLGEFRTVEVLN